MNEVAFVIDEIMTDKVNIRLCKPYIAISYITLWVRYLVQKSHLSFGEIWERMNKHLSSHLDKYNKFKWRMIIENAYNKGAEYPLREINSVLITKHEMNCLNKIKGVMTQKVMFTLLVLSKFYTSLKKENNYWCNTDNDFIKKLANYSGSLDRFYEALSQLRELDLIQISMTGTNIAVKYDNFCKLSNDNNDEIAFEIQSLNNLGLQYMYNHKRYSKKVGICVECKQFFYRQNYQIRYCKRCKK